MSQASRNDNIVERAERIFAAFDPNNCGSGKHGDRFADRMGVIGSCAPGLNVTNAGGEVAGAIVVAYQASNFTPGASSTREFSPGASIISARSGRSDSGGRGSGMVAERSCSAATLEECSDPGPRHQAPHEDSSQEQAGVRAKAQHAEALLTPLDQVFLADGHDAAMLAIGAQCVLDDQQFCRHSRPLPLSAVTRC